MATVHEGWLAGRMVGTLRLGGEYASNEWRAAAGAMSNGQKICPISAKE